jgi:hypothetical protein
MEGLVKMDNPHVVERGINALKAQLQCKDENVSSAATEVLKNSKGMALTRANNHTW